MEQKTAKTNTFYTVLYIHLYIYRYIYAHFFQICFNCKEIHEMGVLDSFSIKIFLSDEMDLRLFLFSCDVRNAS